MLVSEFDYELPRQLVAQQPAARRDESRLLVLERETGALHDCKFQDIREWLRPGDLLVVNDTRVIPARVFGWLETGARIELLLLRELEPGTWEALSRPARKARPGTVIEFDRFHARVKERKPEGIRVVEFEPQDVGTLLEEQGELALPPYIHEQCEDPGRYQTVFARKDGAVAAPTAGLHFTAELLAGLKQAGVEVATVTLHAGLGTFRPVKAETVEEHRMHPEEFEVNPEAAARVNAALEEKRRVVCCGTTTVRALEGQARLEARAWRVEAGKGETGLYIYPGYEWRVTGAMLTNFHLPRSTLLMLVCAFGGRDQVLAAYRHVVEAGYRFYSFGDSMFVA